jgi:hypothetical protein
MRRAILEAYHPPLCQTIRPRHIEGICGGVVMGSVSSAMMTAVAQAIRSSAIKRPSCMP